MSKIDLRSNDDTVQAIESLLTLVANQKPVSFIVLADLGNQKRFGSCMAKSNEALVDLVSHAVTAKNQFIRDVMQQGYFKAINSKHDDERSK